MAFFGIGIGSCVSACLEMVEQGIRALDEEKHIRLLSVGEYCFSAGVGTRAGAWFCNNAALVETPLHPDALMRTLFSIERRQGRLRVGSSSTQNASRTLDLDILCASIGAYKSAQVTLPHPRLFERAFALEPLACAIDKALAQNINLGLKLRMKGAKPPAN